MAETQPQSNREPISPIAQDVLDDVLRPKEVSAEQRLGANDPNLAAAPSSQRTNPFSQVGLASQSPTVNPRHTGITRDVTSPSSYFLMLMAALPARYAFRATIDTKRKTSSSEQLSRYVDKRMEVLEKYFENPEASGAREEAVDLLRSIGSNKEEAAKTLDEALDLRKHIIKEHLGLKNVSGMESAADLLKTAESAHSPASLLKAMESGFKAVESKFSLARFQDKMSEVKGKFKDHRLDYRYDDLLGVGSFGVSAAYTYRVQGDLKDIFAETVAYEMNKNPNDITFADLRHSENAIVQSTIDKFYQRSAARFGTDAMFFGRNVGKLSKSLSHVKNWKFGDTMIGVKGLMLLSEVINKDTSIFEDISRLVDNKINPAKGLGEAITQADVIDLYQKYSMDHNKKGFFNDATEHQRTDGVDWPQAEALFSEVADLMNQTYKYKHSSADDLGLSREEPGAVDFTLPKLVYMLGENMIDAHRVKESYALVEVAGRHGIEALKDAKSLLDSGKSIEAITEKYPVDFSRIEAVADLEKMIETEAGSEAKTETQAPKTGEMPHTTIGTMAAHLNQTVQHAASPQVGG